MDGPEAAPVREVGGKPVPAETVQDDHSWASRAMSRWMSCGIWLLSMYTYKTRYGLRLVRVEMAAFTLGARRRPPDSHRPRMTSQAGHLGDPGVGAQLATWYHSGGGLLARD